MLELNSMQSMPVVPSVSLRYLSGSLTGNCKLGSGLHSWMQLMLFFSTHSHFLMNVGVIAEFWWQLNKKFLLCTVITHKWVAETQDFRQSRSCSGCNSPCDTTLVTVAPRVLKMSMDGIIKSSHQNWLALSILSKTLRWQPNSLRSSPHHGAVWVITTQQCSYGCLEGAEPLYPTLFLISQPKEMPATRVQVQAVHSVQLLGDETLEWNSTDAPSQPEYREVKAIFAWAAEVCEKMLCHAPASLQHRVGT